ncbi:MAG: F0F1 ATP synthase subunit delta [Hydrogenophilaceae bacterium]|nr:F0F1 ATP synthase subunit delta [Hydrogenophilaceae bacterium]
MAEVVTIARPYAEAIARLAREQNTWSAWSDMLNLAAAVVADPQMAAVIANPAVSSNRAAELVLAVCGGKLNAEGANTIKVLAENKRLDVLPVLARLVEEMKADAEGALDAKITSAFPLSEAQMAALVDKLAKKYGRKVSAIQETDASLIGGVVITVGDEVLDASVRAKLAEMAVTLQG